MEPLSHLEHSCGCIIYRYKTNEILLIKQRGGGQRWAIPKGHIEPGETREDCARRETFEETGIEPQGDLVFVSQTTTPVRGGMKHVDIFVSFDDSDLEPVPQATEVADARFWDIDSLPDIVSYQQRIISELIRSLRYANSEDSSATSNVALLRDMNSDQKRGQELIKEFVSVLCEDDTAEVLGGLRDAGLGGMGGGGMGHGMGAGHALDDIFLKPFTDAFRVTGAELQKTSVNVKSALNIIYDVLGSTLIPWVKGSYDKIFAEREKKIKEIEGKYKEYYNRIWAPYDLNDVTCLAFFASPPAMISFFLAKGAPDVAMSAITHLVNSDSVVLSYLSKVKQFTGLEETRPQSERSHRAGVTTANFSEARRRIVEKSDRQPDQSEVLKKALLNPKLINILNTKTREMRGDAMGVFRTSLEEIIKVVGEASKIHSFDDIQRKFAGSMSPDARRKLQTAMNDIKGQQDKVGADEIGRSIQGKLKEAFIKGLRNEVDAMMHAGVPKDSTVVGLYNEAINKIGEL